MTAHGTRVATTCLYCGKVTLRSPCFADRKFCNRTCSNRYSWSEPGSRFASKKKKTGRSNAEQVENRVPTTCLYCGVVTLRPPSWGHRKFCNTECFDLARQGGLVKIAQKCPADCTCQKHDGRGGRARDKIASSPCLYCGKQKMVQPCHGPGERAAKKFCDRNCFIGHQQNQMATRRATGDTRKYDMTPEEYQARMTAQNGACAICAKKISGKDAHRDHCHATGEWRGLLCSNCNLGLGNFRDDPALLMKAAEYALTGGVVLVHEPSV